MNSQILSDNYRSVALCAIGDVTDINCHSNVPYFFFNEGKRQKFFTDPIKLDLRPFRWKRRLWNLARLITGQGTGGYQYSKHFLTRAERQIPSRLLNGVIITINQVFPRFETVHAAGGQLVYYIDATLKDLVDNPAYGLKLPPSVVERAMAQERRNYMGAIHIVTRSSWIIPTLIDFYKIDRAKISHILPGANIQLPNGWEVPGSNGATKADREFVLGFVGKDWKRKGLPLLVSVRNELVRRGLNVKVLVIGNCPDELQGEEGITFTGFVDKQKEMHRFVQLLSSCDVGCLFSDSEALGISTLEFLRVGVPVAGFYHQGLRDTLMEGASLRFQVTDSLGEIADVFQKYVMSEEWRKNMKEKAAEYSKQVTWEACVSGFKTIVDR